MERAAAFEAEAEAQQVIAQNKEAEIATIQETLRKTLEEKELAEGMVQSLRESVKALKSDLADNKEELLDARLHADVEAKGRVYQKFLAGTIKESVARRHLGHMEVFFVKEGLPLPDPNEDSDSEKEDFVAPPKESTTKPIDGAEEAAVVCLSLSTPLITLAEGVIDGEVKNFKKIV